MIVAIISVYGLDNEAYNNVIRISLQVDKVIICDNSIIKSDVVWPDNTLYIYNNGNLGLSKAFNKVLKDKNNNWSDDDYVFFFDQDTTIPSRHVEKMLKTYKSINSKGIPVGALGPNFYNTSSSSINIINGKKISHSCYEVASLITSSMLTTYKSLKSIGFWNECLFLDLCDWDLCWRLIDNGQKCIITNNTIIKHSIGKDEKRIGVIKAKEGAPIREYYQTRDCLKIILKKYTPIKYKLRFICQVTIRPILHFLLLPNKSERLKYIIYGFRDFLKGQNGEFID